MAPISFKDQSRNFWKHDIKIARDYNKTIQSDEAQNTQEYLENQLGELEEEKLRNFQSLQEFADHLYQSTEVPSSTHTVHVRKSQYTWSPSTFAPKRPTIKELKNLYFSLGDKRPKSQKQLNYRCLTGEGSVGNQGHLTPNYVSNEDGILPCIPETNSSEDSGSGRFQTGKNRKFVVTPAVLENEGNK